MPEAQAPRSSYRLDRRAPPRQAAAQFLVGTSAGVLAGAIAGVLACGATEADFKLLEDRVRAARRDLEEALPTWLQDEVVDRRKAAAAEARNPKERLKGAWNSAVEKAAGVGLEWTGFLPPLRMPP